MRDLGEEAFPTVALRVASSDHGLVPGHVSTVVEAMDAETVLVEFADDQGRAYVIAPCRRADLLTLRYEPAAA